MAQQKTDVMEKLVSLCKRRGFVFQSSEVYGGLNGCWDFGPLGVELLRNFKEAWWQAMTSREDVEGIDASILMHPRTWEASGHVEHFTDPMVDCRECKARFRADQIEDMPCPKHTNRPAVRCQANFTEARQFNLMFKTFVGPVEDEGSVVYLRPETCQGIYVNFLNVQASARQKVPFGIAQIGKAFRNEINTKNFLYRVREFEQMEMQFFVKPGTDEEWFEYWRQERMEWYLDLGMTPEKVRFHHQVPEERAHYAKEAYEIYYEFPFGWSEIEGVHNRTDYDLSRHQQYSGKNLTYFDDRSQERYTPYVIETSVGVGRPLMAFLVDAYREEEVRGEKRTVLRFHPRLAPIKAAVFPLVNRDNMPEVAQRVVADLRPYLRVFYDDGGAVGRRYRRMDEVGTPYCVTVDSQTLQDETVTVRDRDSMEQVRVSIAGLRAHLEERIRTWKRPG